MVSHHLVLKRKPNGQDNPRDSHLCQKFTSNLEKLRVGTLRTSTTLDKQSEYIGVLTSGTDDGCDNTILLLGLTNRGPHWELANCL